jgi:hypothetical protein
MTSGPRRHRLRLLGAALLLALPAGVVSASPGAGALPPACPAGQWAAEFFAGTGFEGPAVAERCDQAVDFDWGAGAPVAGVAENQFSARWTTTATFSAGDHRFTGTSDDGLRILVDGEVVLDNWGDHGSTTVSTVVPVVAGTHTVVVEYYEAWGDAEARASFTLVAGGGPTCAPGEWTATFHGGRALVGDPLAQRCDTAVDFDWGAEAPAPGVPVNNFSARWTTSMTFDAGSHVFSATADDGIRILLDGVTVLDGWADQSGVTYSETVPVTGGVHEVTVEYYEAYGDAVARASVTPSASDGPPTCAPGEWTATFYGGRALAGSPLVQRCDAVVDFDWGAAAPAAGVPDNNFSARWERTETFEAGVLDVTVTGDDGIRVLLDGDVVVDGWGDHAATTYTGSVPVTAGTHTVAVEYYEAWGDAVASASYVAGTGPDPRAATGEWTQNPTDMPVRSVHSTLLPNGKVLLVAGSGNNQVMFNAGTFRASVWDPVADTFEEIPVPEDMFCAGHVHLADGDVMLAGGNLNYPTATKGFGGLASNYEFDVDLNRFVKLPDMREGRWYPTLTMLGDGRINVVGGLDDSGNGGVVLVERFDSTTKTWDSDVSQRWAFWGLYPSLHLMDDGKLFFSGTNTFGNPMPGAATWDLETDTVVDEPLTEPDLRDQSASVLLPPAQDQKVMVLGGGNSYSGQRATSSTFIHDYANDTHVPGPPLATNKMYVNATILPDRTVLQTGGAEAINTAPKHETSIYDPAANAFTAVPGTPAIDRLYHSSALLLPDGRVAVFGSNPDEGTFEMRISLYSPGYLFRGPRPTVDAATEVMDNGSSYDVDVTVPSGAGVRDVSLIRAGSVTHQLDNNLRLVDVPFTETGDGLTLDVPANTSLLPPGPYMLIVTDGNGVPSVADWVEVPVQTGAVARTSYARGAEAAAATQDRAAARTAGHAHAVGEAPVCVPGMPALCCCEEDSGALTSPFGLLVRAIGKAQQDGPQRGGSDAPWYAPDAQGLRPGQRSYGPEGGPRITYTNLGDGCDHNYRGRRGTVCIPTEARRAPDLGKSAGEPVTCRALRREGYLRHGLVVIGRDTQGLDRDGDAVACERPTTRRRAG